MSSRKSAQAAPQPFYREIFTANRLLGRHPLPHSNSDSSALPRTVDDDSVSDGQVNTPPTDGGLATAAAAMFLPQTWSEIEPESPIVAVATHPSSDHNWELEDGIDLLYADASGHLYLSHPCRIGVSTFLIERGLQQTYFPGSASRTIQVNESPSDGTGAPAGKVESVRSEELCLFRCREAILDLRFSCRRKDENTTNTIFVEDERYEIWTVDLTHARSITRVDYRMTWWLPHIVAIRTILSLSSDSPPMISNVPFPFFTNGYGIEVGPYLITLKDSPHIWLMRPGENKPQIIVNENDFKVVIEKGGFPCISPESSSESFPTSLTPAAPILSPSSIKDFHFIWVLSYGYIFRVTFCPFKLLMTELTITVGVSPHTTNHDMNESTPRPFFRFNSYDYRLQEMGQRLYVLDCVEGYISQFQTNGQLEQCIQPAPPIGVEIQLPLKNYCLNTHTECTRSSHAYETWSTTHNFFLVDSATSTSTTTTSSSPPPSTIYHWTSSYQQQCQYAFGGRHRYREMICESDGCMPSYRFLTLPDKERVPAEPLRPPIQPASTKRKKRPTPKTSI